MTKEIKYLIRDVRPNSCGVAEVTGIPIQFAALPDWEFFLRQSAAPTGGWILTEVRSGGKFPTAFVESESEAVEWFEAFIARQGAEKCSQAFNKALSQHGELPKVPA